MLPSARVSNVAVAYSREFRQAVQTLHVVTCFIKYFTLEGTTATTGSRSAFTSSSSRSPSLSREPNTLKRLDEITGVSARKESCRRSQVGAVQMFGILRTYFPNSTQIAAQLIVASLVNEDQSLPRKAPRLVYPPVIEKKPPKPKPVLEYHLIEQKITSAITDFKAGKFTSLAEAGRANGITERSGYFRLRARAAGRASKSDRIKNGSQRLSPEQEVILCQYVDSLDDIRALHRKIGEKAYSMLCENLAADEALPKPLGKQWPARFLERHPGIMAHRPRPNTASRTREPEDDLPLPNEEAHTTDISNEGPQLLLDCQRYLDRSIEVDDETTSQAQSPCTGPAAPANVLIITSGTSSVDRNVSSPTATPPDRSAAGGSTATSFLSAIRSSLAEHRMTFSSRLTQAYDAMKYPLWRTYLIVDTFGIRLDNQTRDPQCVHLGQKSAYNASMLGRLMRPMATINQKTPAEDFHTAKSHHTRPSGLTSSPDTRTKCMHAGESFIVFRSRPSIFVVAECPANWGLVEQKIPQVAQRPDQRGVATQPQQQEKHTAVMDLKHLVVRAARYQTLHLDTIEASAWLIVFFFSLACAFESWVTSI
ncbi:hypothetical protein KCV06_g219, partial [Aureobasidium melanogenum]